MAYFATEYTIHFDDTMAYGSHHFLTAFKLQCAARESFLFGDRVFDVAGVREALQDVHLFTSDAYARNLNPARVGDRIAILLTLEAWGRASARFCFRALDESGRPICAGFQTIVCAKPASGEPTELPQPLWEAMESLRAIEEPTDEGTFRERLLDGGRRLEGLFTDVERATAIAFLASRYPHPQVIFPAKVETLPAAAEQTSSIVSPPRVEAWIFSGQGSLDAQLLAERLQGYSKLGEASLSDMARCRLVLEDVFGDDSGAILSHSSADIAAAVQRLPSLSQPAIYLQNHLGAVLRLAYRERPRVLMGHSFGEIAALGAAGCFDLTTGIQIVCARVRSVEMHGPHDGGLLAVGCSKTKVESECAFRNLSDIAIAGRNSDQQTIVSGPKAQLQQLRDHLAERQIAATMIASPSLFHHPLLRSASQAWYQQLRALPMRGPELPVYSPIGRRLIGQGDDIAATLSSQLVKPFDLQGAIFDLRDAGVTHLIDCGSSGTLTKLLQQIVPEGMVVERSDTPTASLVPSFLSSGRNETRSLGDTERAEQPAERGQRTNHSFTADVSESANSTSARDALPIPIAIVGQGCILPAGVTSPAELFAALQQQRNGLVDLRDFDPHWSEDFYSPKLTPDRSTSHLAGRVRDEDLVAPQQVSRHWFSQLTRTQQLFCIALAPCLAGLKGAKRIRCYLGATADGFEDQDEVSSLRFAGFDPTDPLVDRQMHSARSAFQEPHDAIRSVLEYLVGPGVELTLVDAACASSLYSLALGLWALENAEADAVIAGGVFCPGPGNSCLFSQFKGTTSTGCRPFDARADGVVFSEGAAIVVLRESHLAQSLGLPVAAIVKGVGLSSDGRSTSANVPQTRGQLLSLERCYAAYRLDPAEVVAIEGHGTSTPVGDSTELETLGQFFGSRVSGPIPLHSLKGLLGHAGWAAGTASVIAACEYLRRSEFPAQAHYREPSEALRKRRDLLHVPQQPLRLSQGMIAVDGFGFGGANAHAVLQGAQASLSSRETRTTEGAPRHRTAATDLVVVAWHEIRPTLETPRGRRFNRADLPLGPDHVLLPDLADDMDISQRLAIRLVDGLLPGLPAHQGDWRRSTSLLLALTGKTERGVEATMRVLANRLKRQFQGLPTAIQQLDQVAARSRPSGPYTLQCMMPNVASGRAALQFNFNGPNFVVDAGEQSLEAALDAASLMLRAPADSGSSVVLVAGLEVNPWRSSHFGRPASYDEAAVILALTTRSLAAQFGLRERTTVESLLSTLRTVPRPTTPAGSLAARIAAIRPSLESTSSVKPQTFAETKTASEEFPIPVYSPVWVESVDEGSSGRATTGATIASHTLIICLAEPNLIAELLRILPKHFARFTMALAGPQGNEIARRYPDQPLIPVDLRDEAFASDGLSRIKDLHVSQVLVLGRADRCDAFTTLERLANANHLCELAFLVARSYAEQLKSGEMEIWALLLDAFRKDRVHPETGPLAGLLKSIQREHPRSRAVTVATSSQEWLEALHEWNQERQRDGGEMEVCFVDHRRFVRRLRPTTLISEEHHQAHRLHRDSIVLATAGARGVTAVLAEALLQDQPLTLIALGRSVPESGPADGDLERAEREFYERAVNDMSPGSASALKRSFEKRRGQWEAYEVLRRLRQTGGNVHYEMADATNGQQVDRLIESVVQSFGRIDLLVHGAGIQISKKLEARSLAEFRQTFSTKVQGLHHLVASCRARLGTIPDVHLLTSAYSVFGNDGQHDYGAANETLDRLCDWIGADSWDESSPRWTSIAWLAWDSVGMTHGTEYRALAHQRGLSGITPAEGQATFRQVIQGKTDSAIHVPLSDAEHLRYGVHTIPSTSQPVHGRLVERTWELSTWDVLKYHGVRGEPTFPGAWSVDLMVQTALSLSTQASSLTDVTLLDIEFRRFVQPCRPGQGRVRLIAEETGEWIAVWLLGDLFHPTGEPLAKDKLLAQARLRFSQRRQPLPSSLEPIVGTTDPSVLPAWIDPYCLSEEQEVSLSGPFDCLRDVQIGPQGRQALFRLPQGCPWPTHTPALLLDAAFRVGAMYASDSNDLYVPIRIGRLSLPLLRPNDHLWTQEWTIRSTSPRVDGRRVIWDRTEVVDQRGLVRILLENARASKL